MLTDLSALDQIISALPPSFYKYEIRFQNDITLAKMSSGERQFLLSMSTVLYHIKNLISVPNDDADRIKYKNFNIILDEIELCFHPEYQREFICKLIGCLTGMCENHRDDYSFNIIIATHSPFILSDIPNCNILYLEEGKQRSNEEFAETFSANINDILKQSFFLNNGFIGEYAQQRITSLLEYFDGKNGKECDDWNKERADYFIDIVGEPLIKQKLRALFNTKFDLKDDKDREIEMLKREITRLKKVRQ